MRHGSMFSGIEGFGLGLEIAGWPIETVWQSEIDPFCVSLLERRYPDVVQLGDITAVDEIPDVDLLTAGFPCQPVSQAGRGAAQDDPRWLWPHVARVIRKVRPRLVIAENVRGLRSRGLSIVLDDLARAGYDAQWDLLPAAAVGAPHLRHRFWIVAYPHEQPLGRVFGRRPPVFPWAPEEPFKPRLLRDVPDRRDRLRALGNGVVPHAVAGVALSIAAAGTTWNGDGWMIGQSNAKTLDSFDGQPPVAGALIDGKIFPLPTSAPKIKTRLWPTATANEGEWSLEAIMRCVDKDGNPARDPHVRHYHPDTGQIVQRTLSNYVKGAEAGLWPTPVASDSFGSRRRTARTDQWQSNDGVTLLDAVWLEEGVDNTEAFGRPEGELLYPTPLAADADGSRGSKGKDRPDEGGLRLAAARADELELWPTPLTGANRKSTKAMTASSGNGRREGGGNSSTLGLEQAAEISAGVLPHDLPPLDELAPAARGQVDRLWPTAAATDYKGVSQPGQRRGQLEEAVRNEDGLWPTPSASDGTGGRRSAPEVRATGRRASGTKVQRTLNDAVHEAEPELWPTPNAADGDGGRHTAGNREGGQPLAAAVNDVETVGGSLNPLWVEWLMGYPPGWTASKFVPFAEE